MHTRHGERPLAHIVHLDLNEIRAYYMALYTYLTCSYTNLYTYSKRNIHVSHTSTYILSSYSIEGANYADYQNVTCEILCHRQLYCIF